MRNFLIILLTLIAMPCYAITSEFFQGMDENALKAGISKYILTRGGKVFHGNSYEENTFRAIEQFASGYSSFSYNYIFNLVPENGGTRLNLAVSKIDAGLKPVNISAADERKIMDAIITSIKGRFLYGLGFEFDTYQGKIKAPKGKETGIVLTAVRYDALKKGLQKGDVIIEINGIPLREIPLEKYATILVAKSLTDSVSLTYKRKGKTGTVTLVPRLSNIKTF